jgi:hypothetical protein
MDYHMLETMYVHCAHCGYDNSPEYRFCGMCGAALAHPPVATKTLDKPETTVRETPSANGNGHSENVHGPSFLGLAEDPKVEFHYLYEDEQPRSHVGVVVFLLLILGAAGYLGWQWKNAGFPFNGQLASRSGGSAQTSASPSEVAPAQTQDQETHIDKPMTGGAGAVQTPPPQPQLGQEQAATENKPPESAKAGGSPAAPEKAASGESAPKDAPKGKAAERQDQSEDGETAAATPAPKARTPKPASVRTPIQKAAPAAAPDSDLELTGERYLYGNGVPQNCARAESSLRTAATHGNSKAQTVLGTMYATGHCVGRDLPAAYRWFARALHQDPQNSRISTDLQVLWRQMTPQEKQLATASGQ